MKMSLNFQHCPRTTLPGLQDASGVHYFSHKGNKTMKGNQLRFNLDVSTHPTNLVTQFSNPCPIIIEKLCTTPQKGAENLMEEDLKNSSSSFSFSVISEERLNLAVQLARRDVKRKHLAVKHGVKPIVKACGSSPKFISQTPEKVKAKPQSRRQNKAPKCEVTRSGAQVYVYTPEKSMLLPVMTDSPPTLDSGPGNQASPKTKVEESEQEVHHLQKELQTYMQKIEELARRDKSGEVLDPDEEARGRIRQRERIARSSRMLYVLQQQIKEIQSDLEQLSPQPIRHTKKSRTMSRLAAVHRGAIRALQMFVSQLSERGEQQVPALYKELGHLIRQLSLCTAKLDTGLDAAASKTIISLLQQVEDLDILLEHKMYSHSGKSSPYKTTSRSPSSKKECNQKAHNGSPRREKKCPPPVFKKQVSREEKWTNINRQLVADKPPESLTTATQTDSILKEDSSTPERRAALKSGLKALIQAGGLKGLNRMGVGPNRSKGVLLAQRPQPPKREPSQRTHFQAKTKSFMLKENRPSVREKKTPWVPPNPTSPPASIKRVNWDKQQKQMNDSPKRKLDQTETSKNKEGEKEETVRDETVRCAGLDFETARRMQELDKLYREEISCIQNLREDMHTSRTQDPSGNNTTQQQVHSLTGKITDKNLQNSYPPSMDSYLGIGLQDSSDLENMIQRMEEIEKYQETVRQRFNQIVYADPEFWVQEEKERASATIDQRPCSPHPIRITKPTGQREPVVDIFLGEPFEGDSLQISKEELAISFPHHLPPSTTPQTEGCLQIAIPTAMLHRIKDYSDRYQRHLLLTSHEEVGSFNPWHISESLAEQLLDEALDEVAEELQGICETYAEAIFTAEFLEPTEGNH